MRGYATRATRIGTTVSFRGKAQGTHDSNKSEKCVADRSAAAHLLLVGIKREVNIQREDSGRVWEVRFINEPEKKRKSERDRDRGREQESECGGGMGREEEERRGEEWREEGKRREEKREVGLGENNGNEGGGI